MALAASNPRSPMNYVPVEIELSRFRSELEAKHLNPSYIKNQLSARKCQILIARLIDAAIPSRAPFPPSQIVPTKLDHKNIYLLGTTPRARMFCNQHWQRWPAKDRAQIEDIIEKNEIRVRRKFHYEPQIEGSMKGDMEDYWPPGEGIVGTEAEEREGGAEWEYDSEGNFIGNRGLEEGEGDNEREEQEEKEDTSCALGTPGKEEVGREKEKVTPVVPGWNPINKENVAPGNCSKQAVEAQVRSILSPVSEVDEAARRAAVRRRVEDNIGNNSETSSELTVAKLGWQKEIADHEQTKKKLENEKAKADKAIAALKAEKSSECERLCTREVAAGKPKEELIEKVKADLELEKTKTRELEEKVKYLDRLVKFYQDRSSDFENQLKRKSEEFESLEKRRKLEP